MLTLSSPTLTDYGMEDFLARKPMAEDKVSYLVDSELLNGRLAMIAVGGIATQSIITGHGFPWI
jgi:Chlorophyll A-B binding protein